MSHRFHSCTEENCFICLGGLSLCEICNCAEASLLTTCPEKIIDMETQDAIMKGQVADLRSYVQSKKVRRGA